MMTMRRTKNTRWKMRKMKKGKTEGQTEKMKKNNSMALTKYTRQTQHEVYCHAKAERRRTKTMLMTKKKKTR